MRVKYVGPDEKITIRGVMFAKGKAVNLGKNPDLAAKVCALDCFERAANRKAPEDG